VYTLFFATTIVCGSRGMGWWGAHMWKQRAERARTKALGNHPTLTIAPEAVAA
jgi:hypothetical protein